jgi:hypothetical protein
MNGGNYDGFTNGKIVPEFSREELRRRRSGLTGGSIP